MQNLQNLLLVLTEDVSNVDEMINIHLSDIKSIDGLVDIDILKDYKSKLISDIIHLNHESQKELLEYASLKKELHNLMCFYSEFIDRAMTLIRNYSKKDNTNVASEINMTGANSLLFKVLQEIGKMEKHQIKDKKEVLPSNNDNIGYDIDGVVLV
jgi:hypothetical protein